MKPYLQFINRTASRCGDAPPKLLSALARATPRPATLFHFGVLILFLGHLIGSFTPIKLFEAIGLSPAAFRNFVKTLKSGGRLSFVCWPSPLENLFISIPMSATAKKSAESSASAAVDGAAVSLGFSAAITIVFNTLLAWVKDAYEPVKARMARLLARRWPTHGAIDPIVFVALGFFFMQRRVTFEGTRRAAISCSRRRLSAAGVWRRGWRRPDRK